MIGSTACTSDKGYVIAAEDSISVLWRPKLPNNTAEVATFLGQKLPCASARFLATFSIWSIVEHVRGYCWIRGKRPHIIFQTSSDGHEVARPHISQTSRLSPIVGNQRDEFQSPKLPSVLGERKIITRGERFECRLTADHDLPLTDGLARDGSIVRDYGRLRVIPKLKLRQSTASRQLRRTGGLLAGSHTQPPKGPSRCSNGDGNVTCTGSYAGPLASSGCKSLLYL